MKFTYFKKGEEREREARSVTGGLDESGAVGWGTFFFILRDFGFQSCRRDGQMDGRTHATVGQRPPALGSRHSLVLLDRPVRSSPSVQHAHALLLPSPPLPPAQHLLAPPGQLVAPAAAHEDAADHVDDPHAQRQQAPPLLSDGQEDGLDVELEEDARDGAFVDGGGLGRYGVLVCDYRVGGCGERVGGGRGGGGGGGFGGRGASVDCGDDGEVVLVFVEVGVGCGEGSVQRVEEGGVEGTER